MTALTLASLGILLAVLVAACGLSLLLRATRKVSAAGVQPVLHGPHHPHLRPIPVRGRSPATESPLDPWKRVSGLTKTEAEELLDWLEGNGYRGAEIDVGNGFVVRFR
jgi:hypothetical protein